MVCKQQCAILSINCILNFVAITVAEETRRHLEDMRHTIMLKYKAFQASIGMIMDLFGGLYPNPTGGVLECSQTTKQHFPLTLQCSPGLVVSYCHLNSIPRIAPEEL